MDGSCLKQWHDLPGATFFSFCIRLPRLIWDRVKDLPVYEAAAIIMRGPEEAPRPYRQGDVFSC